MDNELIIKMYSFTLDCKDPNLLAEFYAKLLKWEVMFVSEDWACVGPPGSLQGAYPCILFQKSRLHTACLAGRTRCSAANGAY